MAPVSPDLGFSDVFGLEAKWSSLLDVDLLILLMERSRSEDVELLELQIYTQFGRRLRGCISWLVRGIKYVIGGNYKL